MAKELRISAGAIVLQDDRVLMVRYPGHSERGYLVGPGGGAEDDEALPETAVREVQEETGLIVSPRRILFVEDLFSERKRVTKTWFLCVVTGGELAKTRAAADEGIVEVGWFGRGQLEAEVVFPSTLLGFDWQDYLAPSWEALHIESRNADL